MLPTTTASTYPQIANLVGVDDRTSYDLCKVDNFVGRSIENDIVLCDDVSMSRRHACISRIDHMYYLRDLKSSNGTLLNGLVVEGIVPLKQNDEIYFGRSRYLFDPTLIKLHETPPFGASVEETVILPASPWLRRKTFWHHLKTQARKLIAGLEKQKNCLPSRESLLSAVQR